MRCNTTYVVPDTEHRALDLQGFRYTEFMFCLGCIRVLRNLYLIRPTENRILSGAMFYNTVKANVKVNQLDDSHSPSGVMVVGWEVLFSSAREYLLPASLAPTSLVSAATPERFETYVPNFVSPESDRIHQALRKSIFRQCIASLHLQIAGAWLESAEFRSRGVWEPVEEVRVADSLNNA